MARLNKTARIERAHLYATKYAEALLREAQADEHGLVMLLDAWERMAPMHNGYVNDAHDIVVTLAEKLAWHARTHRTLTEDEES